jgi:hypothetical protein
LFPASTALLTADLNHDIFSFFLLIFEGKKKNKKCFRGTNKGGVKKKIKRIALLEED